MRFNYHGYSGLTSISSDPGYHPPRSLGSNNAALAKNRKTATKPIHFQNVAGKNFFSLVVMMGAIPKRRVISRRHIGEMTGGQQSAGRLGEEFNPFFGRHFSPDLTKRKFKHGKELSPRGLECECTQEVRSTSITKQLVTLVPVLP